jgi:hypothetical protein
MQLANLFIRGDDNQKKDIESIFANHPNSSWQLVIFLRRLGKLIESTKDDKLLDAGLAAGIILVDKDDPRDVSISIALFKFGADKAGIDLLKYAKATTICPPAILKIIEDIYDYSEESVAWTNKHFGPKEWIED